MWHFGLIIQCPVYSDMQDGGVKKKNESGVEPDLDSRQLKNGVCLFYPAVSLRGGFLNTKLQGYWSYLIIS